MTLRNICILIFYNVVVNCQSLPQFEYLGNSLGNNSFVGYIDGAVLMCLTNSSTGCCNNSNAGGWRDERGRPVEEGANGTSCLYVTRGDGVISLHSKSGCTNYTSGLWRCDIPDSSGEMQSLYAYISSDSNNGKLTTHMNSV